MKFWLLAVVLLTLCTVTTGRSLKPVESQYLTGDTDVAVQCVFCQVTVRVLQVNVLSKMDSAKEMEQKMTDLCLRINDTTKAGCQFMGVYLGDRLWELQHYTPLTACHKVFQVCPASKALTDPSNDVELVSDVIPRASNNSLECTLCKDVVAAAKFSIIANEKWIAGEIESLFCDELPKDTAATCKKAIEQDLPEILEKYLVPELICGYIKLC